MHPRRIELVAKLLVSLATDLERQVIVTTHSPLFCDAVRRFASGSEDVRLFNVRRIGSATAVEPFDTAGPMFTDSEIAKALESENEDGLFERLLLRGLIDE